MKKSDILKEIDSIKEQIVTIHDDLNLCASIMTPHSAVMPACPASFSEERFPTSGNDN